MIFVFFSYHPCVQKQYHPDLGTLMRPSKDRLGVWKRLSQPLTKLNLCVYLKLSMQKQHITFSATNSAVPAHRYFMAAHH